VENTCPGDVVKINITHKNKNFARARVNEVVIPSPYRVKPRCALQKVCGACQLQFIDYDYQLELKRQIVEDAMRKIGGMGVNEIEVLPVVPSPQIYPCRYKIQYPVAMKKSGRKVAGYYKAHSHEIVNIKHCPVQPEICDKIIDFIRDHAQNNLRHVVIRSSVSTGKNLVVLVVSSGDVSALARMIFDEFEQVAGVCVNFNPSKTNVILGKETRCLVGDDFITEKILDKTFKIGADTFFQVNPKSAENIFAYVREKASGLVLDAYAGVSAFGACVADVCEKVISVEENPKACEFACQMQIKNLEVINMDAGEFLKQSQQKFDTIILDPPRKGCTAEALDEAMRLCKGQIIYVSCNPATLARDLKHLISKGAQVESIQPFDMFCHTYHIENVAIVRVAR
jgi:23S rRNA (uracil1939-C5)-methyltransferase